MRWAEATTGSGSIGAGEGEADGEKKRRRERERGVEAELHTYRPYRTYSVPYVPYALRPTNREKRKHFLLPSSSRSFSPSPSLVFPRPPSSSSPLLSSPLLLPASNLSLLSPLSPLPLPSSSLPSSPPTALHSSLPGSLSRIGSGQGPFADMSWDHPVHRYVYLAVPCPLYVLSGMP